MSRHMETWHISKSSFFLILFFLKVVSVLEMGEFIVIDKTCCQHIPPLFFLRILLFYSPPSDFLS